MSVRIYSAAMFGFECRTIEVEVDILNGLASITIVGLGDTAIQEAKERIRCAIKNSGAEYPRRKKTINLAPADIPKHGPMFDVPIALGLLLKSDQIPGASLEKTLSVGELALSGELRPVSGILPIVAHAKALGFERVIIPESNAEEASLVPNIDIIGVQHFSQLLRYMRGEEKISSYVGKNEGATSEPENLVCFEDIHGQEQSKRALVIAAAGGHNVLLHGPPGSGKTLLARALQSILPPLVFEQAVEVTKLYSIAGKIQHERALRFSPPFRSVHHTASTISLIGGGAIPKPGEISLAHRGVLFLDELLEFSRSTLDCLRQPLEDGFVRVSRAKGSATFPANFMLVAAMNPCPCGYFGDPERACKCRPPQLDTYQKKLSGPLLDRLDIECYVPRLSYEKITSTANEKTSAEALKKVNSARDLQYKRYGSSLNGQISSYAVRRYCSLSSEANKLLRDAFKKLHCSGRAYYRILKVARTIADLEASEKIEVEHLAEALQYRPRFDRK